MIPPGRHVVAVGIIEYIKTHFLAYCWKAYIAVWTLRMTSWNLHRLPRFCQGTVPTSNLEYMHVTQVASESFGAQPGQKIAANSAAELLTVTGLLLSCLLTIMPSFLCLPCLQDLSAFLMWKPVREKLESGICSW